MPPPPLTLLVDNGSLQPAATFVLRELASQLGERLKQPVEAVSLLHSSGIDPQLLRGRPAEILFPALQRRLEGGQNDFTLVPLFFGPSQALTVYVPDNLSRLRAKFPNLRVTLAPPLHASDDTRLARILADHVRAEVAASQTISSPPEVPHRIRVALVDHGSPSANVTEVRNELARQLAVELGSLVAAVSPCSMERRPEPAYNFCDPALSALLATSPWSDGRVIVAMQFLLPGRHAGPDGDVAEICRAAEAAHPDLRTVMTKLVTAHPLLIDILADRWSSAAL
jgi:sirohydrochlorin ferrochelatase